MRLALAGDTMLGRGVADVMRTTPDAELLAPEVVDLMAAADAVVLNLECCISDRGERFAMPGKPFFFRAPPAAAQWLAEIGVDCVTLANNHALDYGMDALLDTLEHLRAAGVECVGAGEDVTAARRPVTIERGGMRLRIVGVTDHPGEYAATDDAPGVAYADLAAGGVPPWLLSAVASREDADATLVTPHWGPNMRGAPIAHVSDAARELTGAGATLVAGHSAHVFQGVAPPVVFDLGDFLDDYAVDPVLRNDLGLLFLVELDTAVRRVEAIPLELDYAHTRLASEDEARVIERLFFERCAAVGTVPHVEDGRLVVAGE